jgi:hypothetical protein
MRYAMSVSGGLTQSVRWLCVIGLMIVLTSDVSASSEKPEKPQSGTIDPALELIYLDRIDRLTVDLEACEKALEIKEDPPECKTGFPWAWVLGALVTGYIVNDIVD